MDNWWTIVMKIIMMIFWLKTFGLKTFGHKNIWLSFYTSCRSITLNYMFIYLFNEDLKMSWLHLIMLNFWEICSWSYILCIQKPLYMIYIVFSFTVSHGWSRSAPWVWIFLKSVSLTKMYFYSASDWPQPA